MGTTGMQRLKMPTTSMPTISMPILQASKGKGLADMCFF